MSIYVGSDYVGDKQNLGGLNSGLGEEAAYLNEKSVLFTEVNKEYATKVSPSAEIGSGITTQFSSAFWAKSTASGIALYPAMGHYTVTGNQQKWAVGFLSAGGLRLVTSQTGSTNTSYDYTGASYNDGTWRHFCFTYDGGGGATGVNFYVNGSNVHTTNAIHSTLFNSTFDFRIGSVVGGGGNLTFDGYLDECCLFDIELTSGEVAELYNSGTVWDLSTHSQAANLVGWWRMGDGDTYPTLTDQMGFNDLTMTNMVAGDIVADVP